MSERNTTSQPLGKRTAIQDGLNIEGEIQVEKRQKYAAQPNSQVKNGEEDDWIAPKEQKGDGFTPLNAKYGY